MPERRVTIGDRSHMVDILAPAGTAAVSESAVETKVPAAIERLPIWLQPRESVQIGGVQNQTHYTVNISYRTDVLASFVIQERCCTQRRFEILSVAPSDRRDAIEMHAVTAG